MESREGFAVVSSSLASPHNDKDKVVFSTLFSASFPKISNYFLYLGSSSLSQEACLWEIDGKSLLLMTRNDVLTGLQLKLGPALKIYEYHVKPLQTKHLKYNSS
ncbi:hypothetical protein FD754_002991 [Muntiacus muntjak]|uniref:SAM domain-containing protein n=1 Tax=Muntiacus muntjak TaxID=9888 RepID=A0A5N3WDR3_MUNMU|nr:hypothetical protein FD754_002991 [Muntiacus muntjak]